MAEAHKEETLGFPKLGIFQRISHIFLAFPPALYNASYLCGAQTRTHVMSLLRAPRSLYQCRLAFREERMAKANSPDFLEAPMSYRTCRHLKPDGLPCGSPALRNQPLCYFHHRELQHRLAFARDRRRAEVCDWKLPPLRTLADVQNSLRRIYNEVLADRLDLDRAGQMLYTLQQAAVPLRADPKGKNAGP